MQKKSPFTLSRINWPLLALGLGAFGIGTTEFAPMGLLPVIADGVNVSIPTAGTLVTAYAIGVMIGAPVITLMLSRFTRRTSLMLLMGIFILGNLLSAMAPGYGTLLVARVITSLSQGAFFGFGAVVATKVVPVDKQASAVATMFMGLSIANIGGVPAAAWIGQHIGWREAFGGTAVLGLLALTGLALALPRGEQGQRPDVARELSALWRLDMLVAMSLTVLFAAAFFTLYTYVAPLLQNLTGVSDNFITLALVLIGLGLTLGNWLGGRLADWSLDGGTAIGLVALAAAMLFMPLMAATPIGAAIGLVLWAVAAFIIVPPLQVRAMRAAAEAPSLAAAINIAGFNLGNAIGASAGGGALGLGLGYSAIPMTGAILALVALVILWLSRLTRNTTGSAPSAAV
ncbi:MFS transporter, DHA1 family, inner membrane transport protein [Kushneria avicenniae]|uniref:MFS transporter, DHA1 family, inner membrane transport protein n=1 Tax=Kushneria avicenniae TaxID=402385 RepID=A0A1I1N339_9GAMM|nr:MFS transporter [Kushneria avicenniae]SFC91835.1 MFS transporter, DHA1 family, inner membrane transport protein [Kushneria avicenniae]